MALVAIYRGLRGVCRIPQLPVACLGAGAPTLREPGAAAAAAEIVGQLIAEVLIAELAVGLLTAAVGAGVGGAGHILLQGRAAFGAQHLMGTVLRRLVLLGAVLRAAHGGSAVLTVILMGLGALDMPRLAGLGAGLCHIIFLLIAILAKLGMGAIAIGLPDPLVLCGNIAVALAALGAGFRSHAGSRGLGAFFLPQGGVTKLAVILVLLVVRIAHMPGRSRLLVIIGIDIAIAFAALFTLGRLLTGSRAAGAGFVLDLYLVANFAHYIVGAVAVGLIDELMLRGKIAVTSAALVTLGRLLTGSRAAGAGLRPQDLAAGLALAGVIAAAIGGVHIVVGPGFRGVAGGIGAFAGMGVAGIRPGTPGVGMGAATAAVFAGAAAGAAAAFAALILRRGRLHYGSRCRVSFFLVRQSAHWQQRQEHTNQQEQCRNSFFHSKNLTFRFAVFAASPSGRRLSLSPGQIVPFFCFIVAQDCWDFNPLLEILRSISNEISGPIPRKHTPPPGGAGGGARRRRDGRGQKAPLADQGELPQCAHWG